VIVKKAYGVTDVEFGPVDSGEVFSEVLNPVDINLSKIGTRIQSNYLRARECLRNKPRGVPFPHSTFNNQRGLKAPEDCVYSETVVKAHSPPISAKGASRINLQKLVDVFSEIKIGGFRF
jgi:hypothetical protein